MNFPTLGLNFDLNALVEGTRRMMEARGLFVDVGRVADQASDKVEAVGSAFTGAGLAAEAAAFKAIRATKSQESEVQQLTRRLRELQQVQRLVATADRIKGFIDADAERRNSVEVSRSVQGVFNLRTRLGKQLAAEDAANTAQAAAAQKRADADASGSAQAIFALRQRLNRQRAQESARASEEEVRGWERVANAIGFAANQTVRAAQTDAEARVRITQAAIAQNRVAGLTQDSLTREALLVDRLTKELQELGQARGAAARQSAPAGANSDLLGQAASTTVLPVIATAQSGLNNRAAQLAENQSRETGRRGIISYVGALFGLGQAQDQVNGKVRSSGNVFTGFGNILRQVRLRAFDLRFALAGIFAAITLGPLAGMADQMVALESRTRLYAARASDVPILLEATYAAAQRSRAPLEGVATLYSRLAPLGDQLGRSQMQLLGVVETVSKAFSIGGASAAEATAGAQQFAQALSSNRFGGDELRSVAENAPVLLAAIAEGVNQINPALNLNAATFIKWAQEGNANSETMVRALEFAAGKINTMFESTTPTIGQATTVIQNSLTKMVDEVDRQSGEAGMRLSTNIAEGLVGFSEFLQQESTIDAIVASVQGLKTTFDVLGTSLTLVAQYFPVLVTALVAYAAAANAAAIASAFAPALNALSLAANLTGLAFSGAAGRAVAFSLAQSAVGAAAVATGGALKALGTAIIGPAGLALALTAGVGLLFYMKNNMLSLQQASERFSSATDTSTNALQRAVSYVETYGGATDAAKKRLEELNKIINLSNDLTDEQTRGLDAAGQKALQRAKQEQALTVALLRRAAAEQIALQASLNRSAGLKRLDASAADLAAASPFAGLPGTPSRAEARAIAARQRASADTDERLAGQLSPSNLMAQADALAALPPVVPDIPTGSNRVTNSSSDDKDGKKGGRGLNGAINSVATLRAEVEGLNDQIQALSTDPLSDVSARIIAAAREAGASRTAGPGAGFANEAQRLAALKEEATIRLDLTKGLINQARAADEAGQADYYGRMYSEDATAAMTAFYGGASRSSAGYIAALRDQADAGVAGQKALANLAIAQEYGVVSTNNIADAYRQQIEQSGLLTDETSAYADALQLEAERTAALVSEAINLAEARKRSEQTSAARLARQAEIADLEDYAEALAAGTQALDAYNRQKAVNEALEAEGPVASTGNAIADAALQLAQQVGAQNDVDRANLARYNGLLAERQAFLVEGLRLTTLTVRQRQIEVEAIRLANAAGRVAANDNDRTAASGLLDAEDKNALKTDLQETVRNAFIETGSFDFTALAEKLGASIRRKLYDQLVAKPIDMVINAGVDFITGGVDKLLDAAGPWGKAAAAALAVAAMVFGREQVRDNRDYFETAEETQARQGTGTVLGSLKAQSESLKRSIDIVAEYENRNLEYSNGMLRALLNIESGIGSLTGLLGRQLGVGGALDTSGLGLGTSTQGPGLLTKLINPFAAILPGLFGSTTTTNLMDQGLQFNQSSLADVLNNGINGSTYQDVSRNTTKKFFGVTYSNKTTLTTEKKALDAAVAGQIGLVVGSLRDGAVAAADILGIEGAAALLDAMQINIGRISFKDLDADGIQSALTAVFGGIADNMATTILPSIIEFQKAGEGAFETLSRVARQYQVIDTSLASIGKTFDSVGVASLAARERLINLVGGLDEFVEQTSFFAQTFLSDQERLSPVQKRVTEELNRLGLSSIATREQFKRLVMGLDLSTEGGATMYAALLDLAPAFAAVTEGAEQMQERLQRIFEFAQGLLTSSLSTRSPQEKLAIEGSEYQTLLARAQNGDVDALEKLTDASTEYLTAAQQFYASSPEYAALFERVYSELSALSGISVDDPVVTTLETEFQRLIDAVNDGFFLLGNGYLPDTTPTPGAPNTVGGSGGGGGAPGTNADVVAVLETGFNQLSDQIAAGTGAVVRSNDNGYTALALGMDESSMTGKAWSGGRVRQAKSEAA